MPAAIETASKPAPLTTHCSGAPSADKAAVRLVALEAAHAGFISRLYRDPKAMRHLGGPRDEASAAALVRQALSGALQARTGQRLWIVQEMAIHAPIGLAGLTRRGTPEVELGLLLLGEQQSRGYGRATVRALHYQAPGFAPGAHLVARHERGNHAMARLLAGLGFQRMDAPGDRYLAWRHPGGPAPRDAGPGTIG